MFLGVKQIEIDTSDWISIEIYDQWSRQAKSPSRKQDSHGVTGRKPWPKIHDLLKWLDQPWVFFAMTQHTKNHYEEIGYRPKEVCNAAMFGIRINMG